MRRRWMPSTAGWRSCLGGGGWGGVGGASSGSELALRGRSCGGTRVLGLMGRGLLGSFEVLGSLV